MAVRDSHRNKEVVCERCGTERCSACDSSCANIHCGCVPRDVAEKLAEAQVKMLVADYRDAATTVHEDSLNRTLYPSTLHKGHFEDCPARVCVRRCAALREEGK